MANSDWHIAQLNVGRFVARTDSPQLADFMIGALPVAAKIN
jgi:hypothetical protein